MIVFIWGTRPESIKIGPVVEALRDLRVPFGLICTGQHVELLRGMPSWGVLRSSKRIALPRYVWKESLGHAVKPHLRDASLVVVQGDTESAWHGCRIAHELKIPVAHLEAGIRSHDLDNPHPEEGYRREITAMATWHYAPTSTAYANLVSEGVNPNRILVTGNTGVSAIYAYGDLNRRVVVDRLLITLHRKEWQYGPDFLGVLEALRYEAYRRPDIRFLFPVHPGVLQRAQSFFHQPSTKNFLVSNPLPYGDMLIATATSRGALTDSGGLQEDCATLGVPCAVMRKVTDRPESIEAGTARLFDPTPEGVIKAVECLVGGFIPRKTSHCFGQCDAAQMVANHLASIGTEA
jgi:UDP-N-acetylglucosamine 2-epimerase (non-hydrolysing)